MTVFLYPQEHFVPNCALVFISIPFHILFFNTISLFFQIVCGITFLIMGTVAFIEEKGELNLGLGIPAGAATILAAGLLYNKILYFI